MDNATLIWVTVLLSLILAYAGLILGRSLGHEHRKRIVMFLCFVCSAVALAAAMYIDSLNR